MRENCAEWTHEGTKTERGGEETEAARKKRAKSEKRNERESRAMDS